MDDFHKMTNSKKTNKTKKQNLSSTKSVDYNTNYNPKDGFHKQYLKNLREKAMVWLSKIKPDDWMKNIRGYDD